MHKKILKWIQDFKERDILCLKKENYIYWLKTQYHKQNCAYTKKKKDGNEKHLYPLKMVFYNVQKIYFFRFWEKFQC